MHDRRGSELNRKTHGIVTDSMRHGLTHALRTTVDTQLRTNPSFTTEKIIGIEQSISRSFIFFIVSISTFPAISSKDYFCDGLFCSTLFDCISFLRNYTV